MGVRVCVHVCVCVCMCVCVCECVFARTCFQQGHMPACLPGGPSASDFSACTSDPVAGRWFSKRALPRLSA